MKTNRFFLLSFLLPALAFGQSNFLISMWNQGSMVTYVTPSNPQTRLVTAANDPVTGNPTSSYNVLCADGFNNNWFPLPDIYCTYNQIRDYINLGVNQTRKMSFTGRPDKWFRPTPPANSGTPLPGGLVGFYNYPPVHNGVTQFNNSATYTNDDSFVFLNYDQMYNSLYNATSYASDGSLLINNVYMQEIGTEMVYFHYYPRLANPATVQGNLCDEAPKWCDIGDPTSNPLKCRCQGFDITKPVPYFDQENFAAEIPPLQLSNALSHFKSRWFLNDPIAIGIATHNSGISAYNYTIALHRQTAGSPPNHCAFNGIYSHEDHLTHTDLTTKADIIREASYYDSDSFFLNWSSNTNYLGKFKNIDYIHNAGYSRVVSENSQECCRDQYQKYCIHSNMNRPNANWQRFLNYTALIHGVDGVVFYTIGDMYNTADNQDMNNKVKMSGGTSPNASSAIRFDRANFPKVYKEHMSELARELRYLANKNLIAPFSVEGTPAANGYQVLYRKKDQATDPNGILPAVQMYLPANILTPDATDFTDWNAAHPNNQVNPGGPGNANTHITGEHGIRYMITTNGTETVMIASNPNPYSLHNITFNFTNIPGVSTANFVDVLFEDGSVLDVNSYSYKTDVTPSVSENNFKLLKKYSIPFCNKMLTTDFGSFDVKIFYFNKKQTGPEDFNTTFNSGWNKSWSNNGSGTLGSWGANNASSPALNPTDQFIPIDYDGDGSDELLCVQNINASASVPAWAKVIDYNGTDWNTTLWNNNNNGLLPGWYISTGNKYIVGDFNRDGYNNELLLVNQNCAAILKADPMSSTFTWYYYNSCNQNTFPGWSHSGQSSDKYIVGDFDLDGFRNDVIIVKAANSGDWIAKSFRPSSGGFVTIGGGFGSGSGSFLNTQPPNALWTVMAGDEYTSGDFNGDGLYNEVLCVDRTSGAPAAIIQVNLVFPTPPTFNSNAKFYAGGGAIGGWGGPIISSDKILAGNLDGDAKSEMLFITTGPGSGWSTTEDMATTNTPWQAQWNWSNHNGGVIPQAVNYIGDWPLREPPYSVAGSLRYLFLKPDQSGKNHLLAFRKFSTPNCNSYLVSMYQTGNGNYRIDNTASGDEESGLKPLPPAMEFNVYPNPNQGSFVLTMASARPKHIQVFDLLGKVVYEGSTEEMEYTVNLRNVAKGLYQLRITENGMTTTKKIIVE